MTPTYYPFPLDILPSSSPPYLGLSTIQLMSQILNSPPTWWTGPATATLPGIWQQVDYHPPEPGGAAQTSSIPSFLAGCLSVCLSAVPPLLFFLLSIHSWLLLLNWRRLVDYVYKYSKFYHYRIRWVRLVVIVITSLPVKKKRKVNRRVVCNCAFIIPRLTVQHLHFAFQYSLSVFKDDFCGLQVSRR